MATKIKRKSKLKKRLSKPKKLTKKIRGGDNPDKCSDIIKAIHNNNIDLLETTVPQCDVNEVVTNPISSPRFKNTDLL